jgi:hypothetical protein
MTHSEHADFISYLAEVREEALETAQFLGLPPEKVEEFAALAVKTERDKILS